MTGANAIDYSLPVLHRYFRMGVRAIHPFVNDPGVGGYAGGDKSTGLASFGRELVQEIQRLHMVLDLTHANDRTFEEVMGLAQGPVIDSHTNCRALCEHERNRTDEQLRAIARTGGVAGVHFSSLLTDGTRNPHRIRTVAELHARVAQWRQQYPNPYEFMSHRYDPWTSSRAVGGAVDDGIPIPRAPLERLAAHIEPMVQVMGVDHVGLGTDYTNGDGADGVVWAGDLPNLTVILLRRGWSVLEMQKVLGGNFRRVLEQVLPA